MITTTPRTLQRKELVEGNLFQLGSWWEPVTTLSAFPQDADGIEWTPMFRVHQRHLTISLRIRRGRKPCFSATRTSGVAGGRPDVGAVVGSKRILESWTRSEQRQFNLRNGHKRAICVLSFTNFLDGTTTRPKCFWSVPCQRLAGRGRNSHFAD